MTPVERLAVIGAGTMGAGIAQTCAQAGFIVQLHDTSLVALDRAQDAIASSLDRFVAKETLSADERDAILHRITTSRILDDVAAADFVIEAVIEDRAAKLDVFAALGRICRTDVILASNTSSIAISGLATVVAQPERVVGLHFMNPVPLMPLVELIRGRATSDETMNEARALCARLGKTPIEAADSPGFIANRLLMPMINEAILALSEGVGTVDAIDGVMTIGMKHPMGPLRLADLIGLDVCLAILEVLHDGFNDAKYAPCTKLKEMVSAGQIGRKSGRGFYDYS
jgi:3-hydroxybutyryl-CoA dehydrogenase